MSSQTNDIIVQIALGATKEILKLKVASLLEQGKEHLPKEKYETLLRAGTSFFGACAELATLTKTKVDDTVVTVFSEPIQAALDEAGISESQPSTEG